MTKLKSIQYSVFESFNNKEWVLEECLFEKVNLIVGKNASGKTRLLNSLVELYELFKYNYDLKQPVAIKMTANFIIRNTLTTYEIEYTRDKIVAEKIFINKELRVERNHLGKVYQWDGSERDVLYDIDFSELMLRNDIAAGIGRELSEWADYCSYYPFAGNLGQFNHEINNNVPKSAEYSVSKFIAGREQFRTDFNDLIIDNFRTIGYDIKEIGVERTKLSNDKIGGAIFVVEKESSARIYQYEMSQGMFRALSLIIQINYIILAQRATCIIIDDIGEGLDYERARKLIQLLIQKSEDSNIQLIMATNDRFVMNAIPLKYWTILDRKGHIVKAYNYQNNKELFNEFEDMGLSNFDFFSSEFYKHGFEHLDKMSK